MTNKEYFKDPDNQQLAYRLDCKLQRKKSFIWSFDALAEKVKWLKSDVSQITKSVPLCPICGKFPDFDDNGFLVCQTPNCNFNEIKITEAIKLWKVRCTNGN